MCECMCESNPIADGRGIISKTIVAGGAAEGVRETGFLQRLMRADSAMDAFSCEARKHNTVIHATSMLLRQYLADVLCCKSMKSSHGSRTFKSVTGNFTCLKKLIISLSGKVSVLLSSLYTTKLNFCYLENQSMHIVLFQKLNQAYH